MSSGYVCGFCGKRSIYVQNIEHTVNCIRYDKLRFGDPKETTEKSYKCKPVETKNGIKETTITYKTTNVQTPVSDNDKPRTDNIWNRYSPQSMPSLRRGTNRLRKP